MLFLEPCGDPPARQRRRRHISSPVPAEPFCEYSTIILCIAETGVSHLVSSPLHHHSDPHLVTTTIINITIPALGVKGFVGMRLNAAATDTIATIGDNDNGWQEYRYDFLSGTSMAVPHVAAAAVLAWSQNYDTWSNQQIQYALARTAIDLPIHIGPDGSIMDPPCDDSSQTCDLFHGYGMVRAKSAST